MDLVRDENFDLKTLREMLIKDFVMFYNLHAERVNAIIKQMEEQTKGR